MEPSNSTMRSAPPSLNRLQFAERPNPKIWSRISFLFDGEGRICSKQEFESLDSIDANPSGELVLMSDDDFPLMLNNSAEAQLAKMFASSGMIRSVRGQNFILPYRKPWAINPSPYYPDFILHLNDGRIAFIELKSVLGMCQDETICKYIYLKDFCRKRGYLAAMIDVDLLTFEEYLWPMVDDEITKYFYDTIHAQGGFNTNNLNGLLQRFSKNKHQDIRRKIASLVLQDPCISNRYCHDDPRLINAVKLDSILAYKKF